MVIAQGPDPSMSTELPEREIAGQSVSGFEIELDSQGIQIVQHSDPLEPADGGIAALTPTAFADDLEADRPTFDQILRSVTIDG